MKYLIMAIMFLVGCTSQMPPAPNPAPSACAAPELQGLVGQPAAALQTMRFGSTVRILRPGTAITMDYLEGRLNIDIGRDEVIRRVYCG